MAKQPRSATPKPKRTPGRPFAADAPDAREAIIKAARRLLETHIPSQVTNSMIARAAGADPALIRYYFGDRASLLMAVVDELFASVREPRPSEPMTIEQFVRRRVSGTLKLSRTTRSMQRIMIDELAESNSPTVQNEIQNSNRQAVELLRTQMGEQAVHVDPLFLHIAIIGMCEFFTSAQSLVMPLAGSDVDPKILATQYEDFICNMLLNGLF